MEPQPESQRVPTRVPKRVKINYTRHKGTPQSPQQEESVDPGQVDDRSLIVAKRSDHASHQSHSPEMKRSPVSYIKQEPISGIANVPSATTSTIAKAYAKASPGSAVTSPKDQASSSSADRPDPDSMDAENGPSTATETSSKADVEIPYTAVNPINGVHNASEMNDIELATYLEYFRSEENQLAQKLKEPQGPLAYIYSRTIKEIRSSIEEIENEQNLRQRRIANAKTASRSLGLSNPAMLTSLEAQQSDETVQRSLRKRPGKSGKRERPFKRPKISKETRQIKDTVMKEAFSRLKGETCTVLDKGTEQALLPIDKAPAHLKNHLQLIENTALQKPGVEKDIVSHDISAFAGILHVFGTMIQPWVSPEDGPKNIGDYKWQLQGMTFPLHHHQVPAIGVMIICEKDLDKNGTTKFALKSGFLFDYMGLGKTIEMLGCILLNQPTKRMGNCSEKGRTTTLIVVPKSAAIQWEKEIQLHCPSLKVSIYDQSCEMEREETLRNDILIVTYDQLLAADRMVLQKNNRKKGKPRTSLLFKSNFWRVCLDEAHKIKNKDSETFRVCCKLKATYKWCASGTPTPNGIAELYSYFKFINHPLVKDFPNFRDEYLGGKKGKTAPKVLENNYEKLHPLLEQIMIMRAPGNKFLDSVLVEIPDPDCSAKLVELSPEEAVIYKYVEDHIEAYVVEKSGRKPKKKPKKKPSRSRSKAHNEGKLGYGCLYEVALRLRQLVSSPLLLEQIVKDRIWTAQQVREMKDEAHRRGCSETPFIDHFETWMSEPKISQTASKSTKRAGRKLNELYNLSCPHCTTQQQQEPHKTQCGCVWCKKCVFQRIGFCKYAGEAIHCPRCNKSIETPQPCGLPGELPSGSGVPNVERPRMRGDDFLKFQPKENFGTSLIRNVDAVPETKIPLSSKMRAILEQVEAWQKDAPDDKIVLFFQFIDTQRLMGRVLQDQGIEFLYFVGEMDYEQREAAKECFRTTPEIKVMNQGAELQAICRVARLGQLKEVHAVRLLAIDTVDSRMYEMQEAKLRQVTTALQRLQEEKSYGLRALRRVIGYRFAQDGDEDDENLFKDQDEIEDEEEDDDTIEDGDPDGDDEED